MKILIAGFGSIGRRHFRNLLALGERDIVFLRSGRSTLELDELDGFPVETDLDAALAHRPQAVIVANPTAMHLDVAIPAARAGCHLLLEKPVSNSLDRVEVLDEILMANEIRTLVGYQFRFHPGLQTIQGWINEGGIGRPIAVQAHWGDYLPEWHPWEDYRAGYAARSELGGGVVFTLSHPIDYLCMLFGDVESVWAQTTASGLGLDVEDQANIALQFSDGPLATIHLNYFQRPARHDMEIIGEFGTIRWNALNGEAACYRAQNQSWLTVQPPKGFERSRLFLAEADHFLRVVRNEEPARCTYREGIRCLKIALTALESSRLGIRLNPDGAFA